MQFYINSPLDQFDIKLLIGIISPLIDLSNFNITTFSLYSIIILTIVLLIIKLSDNNNNILGNRWNLILEIIYDTINNMVKNQIGGKLGGYYFPLIYTLFIFILIANLISMIPYSFAITSHLIFIISISIIIWLSVTIIGLMTHGWLFFGLFLPAGCPLILSPLLILIELLSYSARSISLGLRLTANTLSGHLLMIILSSLILNLINITILGFIPLIAILAIFILEFAIAIIQSYVFTILASGYIKDVLYLH